MPLRMRPVFTWMVPPSCNSGPPPCRSPGQQCYVDLKGSTGRLSGLLTALNVGCLTSENPALMHPSPCHCAQAAFSNPSRQLDVLQGLHPAPLAPAQHHTPSCRGRGSCRHLCSDPGALRVAGDGRGRRMQHGVSWMVPLLASWSTQLRQRPARASVGTKDVCPAL
jgi:hypothetical protein